MSKGKPVKEDTIIIDLKDQASDNTISGLLNEFRNSGKKKVNAEVRNNSDNTEIKLQIDIDVFREIKEIQELPDWVIVKLLLAEGTLKNSSIKELL